VYVHHIHNGFQLDGRPVKRALGVEGQQLSVGYWSIHANTQRLRDTIHVVNGFGLKVEDVILSSLASASMVATDAERAHGVLVIDIGAGMTDYALYRDGFVIRTGALPVAGDHLTNDLSLGLRLSPDRAESLKLEVGKALLEDGDEGETLWLLGDKSIGDRSIPKRALILILEARTREIFSIIKENLGDALDPTRLAGGVILTGGTAAFPQLAKVAEEVLGVSTRLGENPSWVREDLRLPAYSTVLGLLNYALNGLAPETIKRSEKRPDIFHRLAKLLHLAN
jgi:cell division protein FtsA